MPRPYLLTETNKLNYEFVTDQGIRYAIYFLDYSHMFDAYPEISNYVYTFNIDVVEGDTKKAFTDERISTTVAEVVRLFFEQIENVIVYVCDNLDNRQMARKRKFDIWFWQNNDGSIIKEDELTFVEGVEIYNSLLVHKNNKNSGQILAAFRELNSRDFGDK